MLDLSVVVPVYNEEESLPELAAWIDRVAKANSISYEVWMIDDGSTDTSWAVIQQLGEEYGNVRGVKFRRNYGKSAALQTGFERVNGQVVITMDADLQDSPDEIPDLMRMIREEGYDLVSGWKQKRHDPFSKTFPSKFFNYFTRKMSGISLNDFNCGLKAYDIDVVKNIEVYGEMHRYIPVISKWAGFTKIGEKVVKHYPRKYGVTKFGFERFVNGFLDLVSITFVGRFGKKPMHFFGTAGLLSFLIGLVILLYLSVTKVFFDMGGMASRPLFFLGIILLLLGAQLFLTGFLAEMISRSAVNRNNYQIESTSNESQFVS